MKFLKLFIVFLFTVTSFSALAGFQFNPITGNFDLVGSGGGGEGSYSFSAPLSESGGTVSIPAASGSQNGYLSSTNWTTFNGKENALTFSAPLSRSTNTISCAAASGSQAGCLSSTDWTTFNSKASHFTPFYAQASYVNYQNGSDSTGDGSWEKPWQTINAAMTAITDADSNKPYAILLMGSRQVETADILMKPYVSIVGVGQRASYIRAPGYAIKPHSSAGSVASWNLIKNVYLGGGLGLNWDLQALGGSNNVLVLENVTVGGSIVYKGRNAGGGDYLEMYVGIIFGAVTIDSAFPQMQTLEFVSGVTLTNTQAISMASTWNNVVFNGDLTVNAAGTTQLRNAVYSGTEIETIGTNTLDSYRGLPPKSKRTLSGGTTVVNRDDASLVPYVAATAANWVVEPTDVQDAIDKIASGKFTTKGFQLATSGSQPTCDSSTRGLLWHTQGGTGVADLLEICQKDASDVYGWVAK